MNHRIKRALILAFCILLVFSSLAFFVSGVLQFAHAVVANNWIDALLSGSLGFAFLVSGAGNLVLTKILFDDV